MGRIHWARMEGNSKFTFLELFVAKGPVYKKNPNKENKTKIIYISALI